MVSMQDFEVIRVIGKGSYGTVSLAKKKTTNELLVIKSILKSGKQSKRELHNEIQAGVNVEHPSVPRLLDVLEDEETTFLIMEYVEGVNMYSYVRRLMDDNDNKLRLKESQVHPLFLQMASIVQYLHRQGIAHLDIKLENFLITTSSSTSTTAPSNSFLSTAGSPPSSTPSRPSPLKKRWSLLSKPEEIKLLDFGLCEIASSSHEIHKPTCTRSVGSLDYVAPEILLKKNYAPNKADVFSLGVVLYILLVGEIPFSRAKRKRMALEQQHPSIVWPKHANLSFSAKHLLEGMLNGKFEERFTIDEVLNHKWVKTTPRFFSVLSQWF